MAAYLFIESRDPFADSGVARSWEQARALAERGATVDVVLVQNARARRPPGRRDRGAAPRGRSPREVDDVSLTERAMTASDLDEGMEISTMDQLVDLALEDGRKVVWL